MFCPHSNTQGLVRNSRHRVVNFEGGVIHFGNADKRMHQTMRMPEMLMAQNRSKYGFEMKLLFPRKLLHLLLAPDGVAG